MAGVMLLLAHWRMARLVLGSTAEYPIHGAKGRSRRVDADRRDPASLQMNQRRESSRSHRNSAATSLAFVLFVHPSQGVIPRSRPNSGYGIRLSEKSEERQAVSAAVNRSAERPCPSGATNVRRTQANVNQNHLGRGSRRPKPQYNKRRNHGGAL
jgi:hypothetical protein